MKKFWIVLMVAVIAVTGCGNNNSVSKEDETKEVSGYTFSFNGTDLNMNQKVSDVVDKLGKYEYFEAKSCAFEGLDKTYTYSDFVLYTYPIDGVDYLSGISLKSDLVETKEGVCIGQTKENIESAYGKDGKESEGSITYTDGKSQLQFVLEDNVITGIEYIAITE